MLNELHKRILTSVVLIFLISLCIYIGLLGIIIALGVVSFIAYMEFSYLTNKIYKFSLIKNLLKHSVILCYFFIVFLLLTLQLIQNIHNFVFVLGICVFSDVGGYIVGKIVKGPKLTKISPNKTISGSVGSILFSFIPLIILNYFLPDNFLLSNSNILFCVQITIVCQLGDLLISFFKRKAKVKDTGTILPGHGGLLDRIDGIIFALPYASYSLYGFDFFRSITYFLKNLL
tara:strand:+ start:175 stop:867 length:693 start_codon:yes stop_codon:yes gene_type:complete